MTALLWAFWCAADDPRSKWGWCAQMVGMALVGLTGVFAMFASPLMVGRALVRRTWASASAAVVCALTAWMQWTVVRVSPGVRNDPEISLDWGSALLVQGKRIFGTLFVPPEWGSAVMSWVGVALAVVLFSGTVWMARKSDWARRLLGWSVFVLLVMGATIYRFQDNLRPLHHLYDGERYFWIPQVLVTVILIQIAARTNHWIRATAVGLLVVALGLAITRYRLPELRANEWATWAERIERGEEVKGIPITPMKLDFYYPGNPARGSGE